MKISIPMAGLGWSGGNRILVSIANGLVERGHEVNVIVPRGNISEHYDIKFNLIQPKISIRNIPIVEVLMPFALTKHIPKSDFIIANWHTTYHPSKRAEKKGKGKVVYFLQHLEHLFYKHRIYEPYIRNTYKNTYKICLSNWIADSVARYGGETVVINPGVEPIFNQQDIGYQPNNTVVMAFSREEFWKGNQDLFKAMQYVQERFHINLMLVGKKQVKTKHILRYNQLKVEHTKLPFYYNFANIYVQPSWYEGFGLTPLEAMACGTPVITTDSGGIHEYAVKDVNCLIVPPKEPVVLANAIIELSQDTTLQKNLIRQGLLTVKDFSWKRCIDEWEKTLLQWL